MSSAMRPVAFLSAVLPTLFFIVCAQAGHAEDEGRVWDQAAVTKLANKLERKIRAAEAQSRNAGQQPTVLQQRERARPRPSSAAHAIAARTTRNACEPAGTGAAPRSIFGLSSRSLRISLTRRETPSWRRARLRLSHGFRRFSTNSADGMTLPKNLDVLRASRICPISASTLRPVSRDGGLEKH
jgi:hypothetical protein